MNRPSSNKMDIHQVYAPVGAPGGAETEIQFHHGADFGGDAGLTFNHDTQVLTAPETRLLLPITAAAVTRAVTAAECKGGIIFASAAIVLTLPAVVVGYHVTIYSTGANAITITPNGADRIVVNGAAEVDGNPIISTTPAAGDFITLVGDSTDGWTVLGISGSWDGVGA